MAEYRVVWNGQDIIARANKDGTAVKAARDYNARQPAGELAIQVWDDGFWSTIETINRKAG